MARVGGVVPVVAAAKAAAWRSVPSCACRSLS